MSAAFLRLPDGRVVNVDNIMGVQERVGTNGVHGCIIEYLVGGRTLLVDVPLDLVWATLGDVADTATLTAEAALAEAQTRR